MLQNEIELFKNEKGFELSSQELGSHTENAWNLSCQVRNIDGRPFGAVPGLNIAIGTYLLASLVMSSAEFTKEALNFRPFGSLT